MKKIILSIILFYSVSLGVAISQPVTEWIRTYNSPGNYDDYITDMTMDKYGNLYICGYIKYGVVPSDFVTLKYDNSGTLLWSRIYDGPDTVYSEDEAVAIEVDDLGNIYVSGFSSSPLTYVSKDYTLIKYNSNGDTIWIRRFEYDSTFSEYTKGMVLDNLGNVYITGYAYSSGRYEMLTVKYDSSGNLIWNNYFQSLNRNWARSYDIEIDKYNSIYITGLSFVDSVMQSAVTILKYDSAGNTLDTFYYDTNNSEIGYGIEIDSDLYMYISGHQNAGLPTGTNLITLKIDSSGNMNWVRIFDNNGLSNSPEYFRDIKLDNLRNTIVLCRAVPIPPELSSDYVLIKYSQNGDSLWTRRYTASYGSIDHPASLYIDKSNYIYVTGYSNFSLFFNQYLTIKYSPSGELLWHIEYYPAFTNNEGKKILLDTLGNIYVTGISDANGTGWDVVTIKYNQPTGVQNISGNMGKYDLKQNYPNPFNSTTTIEFDLRKDGLYKIEVYDVLGKEVATLVNEFKKAGSYIVSFNGSKLSSGIYFYKIEAGSFTDIKRMVLIK